jgi:Protein tyrosine and serine/threonine kinase
MWELMAYGRVPWMGYSNPEAMKAVLGGNRLQRPEVTPDGVWDLMQECWARKAEDRPSFEECFDRLKRLVDEAGEDGDFQGGDSATAYAKTPAASSSSYAKTPMQESDSSYARTPASDDPSSSSESSEVISDSAEGEMDSETPMRESKSSDDSE